MYRHKYLLWMWSYLLDDFIDERTDTIHSWLALREFACPLVTLIVRIHAPR